jgi:hypothetical protein
VNYFPATHPRTWLIFSGVLFILGTALTNPATLWDPEVASQGGRWEIMAFFAISSLLCVFAAAARWLDEFKPEIRDKILQIADRIPERSWLLAALVTWTTGWLFFHLISDPNWVASGVDWHDSHLDAYALLYNDSPLYCAWRYPFYPMMAAVVSSWTGIDLATSLQAVSRFVACATVIPLFYIGRHLFGRTSAIAGVILLVTLATYRMHTDAVTPYPMVMFLAASGAAGLVAAARGGVVPWAIVGASSAALLATDGKSLLIALGFVGMALITAVIVPWRWRPQDTPSSEVSTTNTPPKPWLSGVILRFVRIALIALPIIGSYNWMGSLPVKAFTLEEMAVAYLIPGGRGASQAPRNLQTGYMWGHFDDAFTIPRTLQTFYEAGKNPLMAEQNTRQFRTSLQRLRLDYPGFTRRTPYFLALCFVVPLARRRGRLQALFQLGAVGVVLASCWPSIKSDYQERYLVHGTVLLPILMMGGVGALANILIGSKTRMRSLARGTAVITVAFALLLWPANPVGFAQLKDRLNPVAMGGAQEHEVGEWGRENLESGDLLLDTSWMMQALVLSGEHTVARATNAYPPGGSAWPAGSWRFTRPWPEERPGSGRYFVLVNYLAMAPNTFDAEHVPIEELITEPDTPFGKKIAADQTNWMEVFRTSDTIVRVYQWTAAGSPPGWQFKRKAM